MSYTYKKAQKVIDNKLVQLKIIQDDDPMNPRTEWDGHYGTMVCWHRRYNLGDEHNYDSDRFFLELANEFDLLDADKGENARRKLTNELFNEYSIDFNEEEGVYEINTDEWYNPYSRELFDSKEIAKEYLDNEKEAYFESESYDDLTEELASELVESDDNIVILPLYLYDHSGITMNTGGFSCGWDSGQVGFIYGTVEELKRESGYEFETNEEWRSKLEEILKNEVETYDQYLTGDVYGFILSEFNLNELEEGETIEDVKDEYFNEVDSCWGFFGDDFDINGVKDHIEEKCQDLIEELQWA